MKGLIRRRAASSGLIILLTAFALSVSFSMPARQKRERAKHLALVGGQLYPAPLERPISDGVVLIEDGKIIAVGIADTETEGDDYPYHQSDIVMARYRSNGVRDPHCFRRAPPFPSASCPRMEAARESYLR